MSCNCKLSVAPLQCTVGCSAVCDCGISSPYLLTFNLKKVSISGGYLLSGRNMNTRLGFTGALEQH